jgi:hypothetical protein
MTALLLRSIASSIGCVALTLAAADEKQTAEVLRAHSPDKKFAMRIICEAEFAKAEEIPGNAVRSVSLVAVSTKEEVAPLLPEDALAGFGDLRLVWSADSQWCAFYSATNRVGYTTAFQRKGERFSQVPTEEGLKVPSNVDTRNEHISPIRWVKPGVLLLEQLSTSRKGTGDFHARFTATYDAKAGKFRAGGVKKLAR